MGIDYRLACTENWIHMKVRESRLYDAWCVDDFTDERTKVLPPPWVMQLILVGKIKAKDGNAKKLEYYKTEDNVFLLGLGDWLVCGGGDVRWFNEDDFRKTFDLLPDAGKA